MSVSEDECVFFPLNSAAQSPENENNGQINCDRWSSTEQEEEEEFQQRSVIF